MKFIESAKYVNRITLAISFLLVTTAWANGRVDTIINSDWKFCRGDIANAYLSDFDDSAWTAVNLPHTWNAFDGQDGGNNYYRGISWYRKNFTIGSESLGKRIYLFFESVGKAADLYCNGTYIGRHEGAYAAFCFDITDAVNFEADNLIAVKVDNSRSLRMAPLSGDFTQWGGICRSVHLLITNPVHITPLDYASPGVYITPTNVSSVSSDLSIKTLIRNTDAAAKDVTVRTTIKNADNIAVGIPLTLTRNVAAQATVDFIQNTKVSNPHLWDGLADPYLYKVGIEVEVDGSVVDRIEQPLGFRSYVVDPEQGFLLNGRYYDLRGVSIHEDREGKGRAISDADREQDIQIMLDMGCTWIRLAHYQHAEKIYDIADEKGVVLWTEVPLVNEISTTSAFSDNCKSQLKELIRQNYNHPSVFFWGIFNEITMRGGPDPTAQMKALDTLAKAEDSTRLTTAAANSSNSHSTTLFTDTLSFNKYFGWYNGTATDFAPWADGIHAERSDDAIGVSEYGVGASLDHHEENPPQPAPGGPWHPEEYQSYYHEVHWKAMEVRPFLWCKTIWNGFDFGADGRAEGDRHGINDKGLVTRDRKVRKDSFYWYKANWSSEPVVYITSRRFTPRNQEPKYIKVYSNCESVELFINGASMGTLTSDDHIYQWNSVKLKIGSNEIKAVGSRGPNVPPYVDLVEIFRTDKKLPELEIISPANEEKVPTDKDVIIEVKASDPDGEIDRVEFYQDDELIGKDSTVPYSFTWAVSDGLYTINVKAIDNEGFANTSAVKITKGIGQPQRPYHGTPASIPGRIQAEDFDLGLPGEAYKDFEGANQGERYRRNVEVDIQDCSEGGYDIGWIVENEWLEYTVDVTKTGSYDIIFRVGSPEGVGKLHLEIDGVDKTGVLSTPRTGDWQRYIDLVARDVELKAGKQVMRIVFDAGSFNLRYIDIMNSLASQKSVSESKTSLYKKVPILVLVVSLSLLLVVLYRKKMAAKKAA